MDQAKIIKKEEKGVLSWLSQLHLSGFVSGLPQQFPLTAHDHLQKQGRLGNKGICQVLCSPEYSQGSFGKN